MHLVRTPVAHPNEALKTVPIPVDRRKLAKRLWRGAAEDGEEFGFELSVPLDHGATVYETASARYVIAQEAETVIEVPLDVQPVACAQIGWSLGNLHLAIEGQTTRLLAPEDPAVRQLLDRMGVHYHVVTAVFRPGVFAGDLHGSGHHHHSHDHHQHDHEHPHSH